MMSLRSKWAACEARGGSISESIRDRRATTQSAHFQRNPPGRGRLAVFSVRRLPDSLLTYQFRYARRSRLEKQPTDLRRHYRYMRVGTLGMPDHVKPGTFTAHCENATVGRNRCKRTR